MKDFWFVHDKSNDETFFCESRAKSVEKARELLLDAVEESEIQVYRASEVYGVENNVELVIKK